MLEFFQAYGSTYIQFVLMVLLTFKLMINSQPKHLRVEWILSCEDHDAFDVLFGLKNSYLLWQSQ